MMCMESHIYKFPKQACRRTLIIKRNHTGSTDSESTPIQIDVVEYILVDNSKSIVKTEKSVICCLEIFSLSVTTG